jgi:signal peptidase
MPAVILRLASRAAGVAIAVAAIGLALLLLLPALLGYQRYSILSGSMSGTYDTGSLVYAKSVPVADLEKGDVITYAPPAGTSSQPLVTHRIVAIKLGPNGERVFRTKGDANAAVDPWTFQLNADTQPRVVFSVPYAGRVAMALTDRTTRVILIGVPAAIIALMVIVGMVREGRSGARNRSDAAKTPASV